MQTRFLEEQFNYDGTQLRSLFAYMNYGILGDSIVSWLGPCNISFDHMLDGEDIRSQSEIRGDLMLHFIVEKFEASLLAAVALQRLLTAMAADLVRESDNQIRREGDDLFVGDKKLSISIATTSPTSTLVHFAVNVKNTGTPVPTISLEELGLNPVNFSKRLIEKFAAEVTSIEQAVRKVRPTTSY